MTARHHHYLSRFYLKGFTKGRAKKSKLTVIDFKTKKTFETIPRNVAGLRDFNRVSGDGQNPNAIEEILAEFEGEAATAIKHLEKNQTLDERNMDAVFNLIALFSIRSPEQRENWRNFHAQIFDHILDLTHATKERWESQQQKMDEDGYPRTARVTYEQAKEFHEGKQYKWELSTDYHIRMEMTGMNAILPFLYERKWVLIRATSETGPFITTDNPVALTFNEPDKVPPLYRNSPGFGLTGTQVYFPVSQSLALLGEFDGTEGQIDGTNETVATVNSRMLNNAYKQVYSPKIGFKFLGEGRSILDGRELVNGLTLKADG